MYQNCWIPPPPFFTAQKSKEMNIIESFNFYYRNFNPCLRRKALCYTQTLSYFNQRINQAQEYRLNEKDYHVPHKVIDKQEEQFYHYA